MKKLPVRLCIGCQQPHSKREMIRIVKSPEGVFSVDATGKKIGPRCVYMQEYGLPERSRKAAPPGKVFQMPDR